MKLGKEPMVFYVGKFVRSKLRHVPQNYVC